MITLITGQPGNGKTLRAMALIAEEYERNAKAVKEGKEEPRRFFSNITGSTTEDNPNAFPWMEKMPEHNDWTKLPHGSYVVYDEAHSDGQTPGLERYGMLFPSTGKPGESNDHRIRAMSTHRSSFSVDLLLITQWPSKVHHQVRTLVGKHVHMNRSMGLEAAGVMQWSRVQVDPYDEKQREKAEEEIWRYPKDLYGRYFSATLHTAAHKFKVPKKVIHGLISTVLVVLGLWWGYASYMHRDKPEKTTGAGQSASAGVGSLLPSAPPSVESKLTPGMGAYSSIQTQPAPTLAGCVATDDRCRCFNAEGYQIDFSQQECRRVLDGPIPYNVFHEFKAPQGAPHLATVAKGTGLAGSVVEGDPAAVNGAGIRAQ